MLVRSEWICPHQPTLHSEFGKCGDPPGRLDGLLVLNDGDGIEYNPPE
jgi:hypothetical protein